METLFDGRIAIAYSQVYVTSDDDWESDLDASFVGQTNGLCGAAQAGFLWLTTGTQDGDVAFRVERHDLEPAVDTNWQDIVEVPFMPGAGNVQLTQWAGEASFPLALPNTAYRVRYCASLMDEADDRDSYALLFWPATARADEVIKQTSKSAAYWHAEMGQRRTG